ncbi:hypothetical protein CCR75_000014 [Bremia lactucae]|uniref:Uncharacterized protein n=1 Tax=Bremia lactucae TaxID=4779 RepID=A0A976IJN4_BRELC|nr:hypothetical protein CCR75_000014 [Bremia lactucae]
MATPRGNTFRSTHEVTYALKISGRIRAPKRLFRCPACSVFISVVKTTATAGASVPGRTKFWVTGAFKSENYTAHRMQSYVAYRALSATAKRTLLKKLKSEDALCLVITKQGHCQYHYPGHVL